jgi:hypothetical protein
VFNLTVAEQPEYFANGVLVHNCDAIRYACMAVDRGVTAIEPPHVVEERERKAREEAEAAWRSPDNPVFWEGMEQW